MQATLNANFGVSSTVARFEWLYLDNPDGLAKAWFVLDDRNGEVVGATAAFPRRVRLKGRSEPVVAWNCGDFSISLKHRTMGAAIKLRRAARESIDRAERLFLYAHPNNRMLQVHLKVGHMPLGRMVRYAKPLMMSTGNRFVDGVSKTMLRLAGADWLVRSRYEIEQVDTIASPEFDALDEAASRRLGTALVRDGAYVDWRFRRNPLKRYDVITARRGGRLAGYLAFSVDEGLALVSDWLSETPEAVAPLFAGLLRELRRRDVRAVSAIALETHPDWRRLQYLGFRRRPDFSTAVTYVPEDCRDRSSIVSADAWYMTVGDRDV
jgi:hypothetical protein